MSNTQTQINKPVENFKRQFRQDRTDFIGWDQNGQTVNQDICETGEGFAVNVTFGCEPVTLVRRYVYHTLDQARRGDIGHEIGQAGCVSYHGQEMR